MKLAELLPTDIASHTTDEVMLYMVGKMSKAVDALEMENQFIKQANESFISLIKRICADAEIRIYNGKPYMSVWFRVDKGELDYDIIREMINLEEPEEPKEVEE